MSDITPDTTARYLRIESIIGGVSNAFFNGVIAWLMLRNAPDRTWSGSTSFAADMVITGFLLPFIVALIVIPIQRGKLRKGKVDTLELDNQSLLSRCTKRLPHSTFRSALIFGSVGALLIAPVTLFCFWVMGIGSVPTMNYIMFKTVWTGLLAALLVIPMVVYALSSDAVPQDRN